MNRKLYSTFCLAIGMFFNVSLSANVSDISNFITKPCAYSSISQRVECEIWFNSTKQIEIDEVYLDSSTHYFESSPVNKNDLVEMWLLDSEDPDRKEENAFEDALSTLISGISTDSSSIILMNANESLEYVKGYRARPTKPDLATLLDDVDLESDKANIADALNDVLIRIKGLLVDEQTNRGILYWVTSRKLTNSQQRAVTDVLMAGLSENVRLIVVPFKKDENSVSLSQYKSLGLDVPLLITSELKPTNAKTIAADLSDYSVNQIQLSIDIEQLCDAAALLIADSEGNSLERLVDLPTCPEPLTACELDPRSTDCLRDQFEQCKVSPSLGFCQQTVLEYCDLDPRAPECRQILENYCKLNPNDNRYKCPSRVLNYCENNPNDPSLDCAEILIKECKVDPGAPGCDRELFEYCDFNTKDPECNAWVSHYCSDNPGVPGCSDILTESCWSNPEKTGCNQRLFDECQAIPTLGGCNEILLEQCTKFSHLNGCEEILLANCDANPDAEGCNSRLVEQCFVDSTPSKCDALLDNFCWQNQSEQRCDNINFQLCEEAPETSSCAYRLLDSCLDSPDNPSCSEWATLHCEMEGDHEFCVQVKQAFINKIIFGAIALIAVIIGFFVRYQIKKVPASLGQVYLYAKADGDNESVEFLVKFKQTYVGRGEESTVQVNDNAMSKVHAVISFKDGEFFVSDLQSLNGVYVNQRRISQETKLQTGNLLRMGNTTFRFEIYAKN